MTEMVKSNGLQKILIKKRNSSIVTEARQLFASMADAITHNTID